jgi:hypothetical protein
LWKSQAGRQAGRQADSVLKSRCNLQLARVLKAVHGSETSKLEILAKRKANKQL